MHSSFLRAPKRTGLSGLINLLDVDHVGVGIQDASDQDHFPGVSGRSFLIIKSIRKGGTQVLQNVFAVAFGDPSSVRPDVILVSRCLSGWQGLLRRHRLLSRGGILGEGGYKTGKSEQKGNPSDHTFALHGRPHE